MSGSRNWLPCLGNTGGISGVDVWFMRGEYDTDAIVSLELAFREVRLFPEAGALVVLRQGLSFYQVVDISLTVSLHSTCRLLRHLQLGS